MSLAQGLPGHSEPPLSLLGHEATLVGSRGTLGLQEGPVTGLRAGADGGWTMGPTLWAARLQQQPPCSSPSQCLPFPPSGPFLAPGCCCFCGH